MKYLKFLVIPLVILVILAVQLAGLLLRGELPQLRVEALGTAQLPAILDSATRRAGVAIRSQAPPASDRNGESGILVVDLPFTADPVPRLAAGPFDAGLDDIRNRAIAGEQVLIGFNCLVGTENPRLAAELASWTGFGQISWVGLYLPDLADPGQLPPTILQTWESANGRAWDQTGPGVVLHSPQTNTVVVLRRGIELDRDYLSVQGRAAGIPLDSLLGGYFAILSETKADSIIAEAAFSFLPPGKELANRYSIPPRFPLVLEKAYGPGRVWTLAFNAFDNDTYRPLLALYPNPAWAARRTLNEPGDAHARFTRLVVPLWRVLSLAALEEEKKLSNLSFRAGERYLERRGTQGGWQAWFVKGVNLGPATPGHWFGDPPSDEATYLGWFASMAEAGFDTIRLYTLLPPAFYRALAAWNHRAERSGKTGLSPGSSPAHIADRVLFLIQEIWPEEEAPGHDLGEAEYLQSYLEESDLTIDALYGRADIAERPFRAWGRYRADVSPWLAAVLVGREVLPEEVLATAQARPDETFAGDWFAVGPGWPVESILARMADRAASRIARLGGRQVPIGFVSWPTLDTLYHPAEWTAGSDKAPYNDRAELDFRAIGTGPVNEAGFFTAYHIYPNYPDFMLRSERYDLPGDVSGYRRYAAYIDELLATQEGIPLLVAEFGLATGYGTAHLHPAGLHHGGLSEVAQAEGLVGLFRTIAGRGATGGVVFQWADEWAKKTWTTETYMIPYDRNPLWHNTIDPEQNYGILAWLPSSPRPEPAPDYKDRSLISWSDPAWLYLQVYGPGFGLPADSSLPTQGPLVLELGLDLVPGRTGEYRLYPEGPQAPQGSEFVIRARLLDAQLHNASLLVYPDYNRGGGRLYPGYGNHGGYTRILTLVNAAARTREGKSFASLWEDGSILPLGPQGLASQEEDGSLVFRLPWSRLNFSDPSQRRILLDPIRDSRAILTHDSLNTLVIDSIGVWAHFRIPGLPPLAYIPHRHESLRIPLQGWERVQAELRPKLAHRRLAEFLPGWDALAEAEPRP